MFGLDKDEPSAEVSELEERRGSIRAVKAEALPPVTVKSPRRSHACASSVPVELFATPRKKSGSMIPSTTLASVTVATKFPFP